MNPDNYLQKKTTIDHYATRINPITNSTSRYKNQGQVPSNHLVGGNVDIFGFHEDVKPKHRKRIDFQPSQYWQKEYMNG
jgi:hypothetical protein